MPSLVFDESAAPPTMHGYETLSGSLVNIFYMDCNVLHRSREAIIFSNMSSVFPELLDALIVCNYTTLFPLLNGLNMRFFFVIYHPLDQSTIVISDRIGQFKLFFTPHPAGFSLGDRLPNLSSARVGTELSAGALSEYIHYRWNNTGCSFYVETSQIYQGSAVTIRERKIQARVRYSDIFWGENFFEGTATPGSLKESLMAGILNCIDQSEPTYVLLSGGVDSAVLLALATEIVGNVVAVTPTHQDHDNPELGRAVTFAEKLGVRHEVLTIPNSELEELFINTTVCIQQPLRHHSSLTLFRTFQSLPRGANVLYGEAADTLFGLASVGSFRARQLKIRKKNRLCSQFPIIEKLVSVLPVPDKVRELINDDQLSALLAVNKLDNPRGLDHLDSRLIMDTVRSDFLARYKVTDELLKELDMDELVRLFKQWLMDTDVTNHFLETSEMASHFGLRLASPFMDHGVIRKAMYLSDDDYFGKDFVKPLLRRLGAEYYGYEMMHLPRYGFPVPYEFWLENELGNLVVAAKKRYPAFAHLPKNSELDWTLAGLSVLDIDL